MILVSKAHPRIQLTFANGWSISIGIGRYHYITSAKRSEENGVVSTVDAETAIFCPDGTFYQPNPNGECLDYDIRGYQTSDDIATTIAWVVKQENK